MYDGNFPFRHKATLKEKINIVGINIIELKTIIKGLETDQDLEGNEIEGILHFLNLFIALYQTSYDRMLNKTTLLGHLNMQIGIIKKSTKVF